MNANFSAASEKRHDFISEEKFRSFSSRLSMKKFQVINSSLVPVLMRMITRMITDIPFILFEEH